MVAQCQWWGPTAGALAKAAPAVQPWALGDTLAVSQNCAGLEFYSFSILTVLLMRVNAWFLCIRDNSCLGESFWWRFCCLVTVLQSFETISEPFYANLPFYW